METKSKLFRGIGAADIQPTFRAETAQLSSRTDADLQLLASALVKDAARSSPTGLVQLSREIHDSLGVDSNDARAMARVGRMFASRLAALGDAPEDVADDLVTLQITAADNQQKMVKFLKLLRERASLFEARQRRQETAWAGLYHLASSSTLAEFRAVFAESDYLRVKSETYVPRFLEFVPVVVLQMQLHGGEQDRSISVGLSEDELGQLEDLLKIARMELEAAKRELGEGKQ